MFCISVGIPQGEPKLYHEHNKLVYDVKYNDFLFGLPEIMFLFWEQFLEGEYLEEARNSFSQQTGFPDEAFDIAFDFLTESKLIFQTNKPLRDFTEFVPVKNEQTDLTLNEETQKILQSFDGLRCLDEVQRILEIDDKDFFYGTVLQLAKKRTFFFIKGK